MRNVIRAGAAVLVLAAFAIPAAASAPSDQEARKEAKAGKHNFETKWSEHQRVLREKALQMKLNGKAPADAKVVQVAKGQYVELAREATDRIFVVIAEFGTTRHSAFLDGCSYCTATVYDGPLHNAIPEPDRNLDNTTLWQEDFSKAHYEDMYFNRMAKFYESQSSGRYSVDGAVTEWVAVPFNEARYGRSGDVAGVDPAVCSGIVCNNTWFLIRDAMSFWVKGQLDAGKTMDEITDYLETFDVWDRYDSDGDGNFDEPDGFIDHFQIVHSGGDEAAGDPFQGNDAIWSHRWYAQVSGGGPHGFPGVNAGQGGTSSGVAIPHNPTGVWVGDYTVQPENGGLGVFAHEYGHDIGLPDLYDTSGNTCGSTCENSTGFWTLMSSGANIGDGGPDGIGDAPTDMGAWEKFQLGWLNYEVAFAGKTSSHKLGPAETNTKKAQGVFVVLPASTNPTTLVLGDPTSGDNAWYSTSGANLNTSMTRSVALPGGGPISLSMKAWYEIETCWDYAYVSVSTDGGAHWTNLATGAPDDGNPNGQNQGNGITGFSGHPLVCDEPSGSHAPAWVTLNADLTPWAGQTVTLGIRYVTDGFVDQTGFEWDDLVITGPGGTILSSDAEAGDTGWTATGGFRKTTGSETRFDPHYYLAEYRTYRGYDTSLATAYNFGFLNTKPDWVEHFRYQDGVLINYWDTGKTDNSTSAHPGEGLILPIDSHPNAFKRHDGVVWRSRVQTYDSTFGLEATDAITLNVNGNPSTQASQPAVPVFDDRKQYWNAETPTAGVKNPNTGTQIRVVGTSGQGNFAQIEVRPAK